MQDPNDLYSTLVGGAPTDPQRQMALAAALRNQNTLGQLGVASGDRVLSPLGKSLSAGAQSGAQDIAQEREKQQGLDTESHYRDIQEEHWKNQNEYQKQKDAADNANKLTIAKLLSQNKLDVQDEKNKAKADSGGMKLPASSIKDLEALRDTAMDVDESNNLFKPGYGGTSIPGGRPLANTLAQMGMGTDNSKSAQNWWAQYGRNFTLDEMHRRFGARLSPQEMSRFEKYHIDPNMTDEQIQQNLGQISGFFHNMVQTHVNDFQKGGYNQGMLQAILSSSKGSTQAPSAGDKYLQAVKSGGQVPTATQPQPAPQAQPQPQQMRAPLTNNLLQGVLGGGS